MTPFNIQQLDHVVLRVVDLARSEAFYCAVLGCQVAKRRDDLGMIHLRTGASMIDLIDVNGPLGQGKPPVKGGPNIDHFCLRITPFDEAAIRHHLQRHGIHGIAPAEERYGAEGTGLSLYFFDPDGNQIELKGPSHESLSEV